MSKPTCSIEECARPAKGRGFCSAHYYRWRIHGDPLGGGPNRKPRVLPPCAIEGCRDHHVAKGYCNVHYMRLTRTGDPLGSIPHRIRSDQEVAEDFWQKVHKTASCWLWTGGRESNGYGHLRVSGEMVKAHRWAYAQEHGPIPDGLVVDHMCHNVACVNPHHLRVVPQAVNAKNRVIQRNNTTGVTGVHVKRLRSGAIRYAADARINGKRVSLGTFGTIEEAAKVATEAREFHYQLPQGDEFKKARARAVGRDAR